MAVAGHSGGGGGWDSTPPWKGGREPWRPWQNDDDDEGDEDPDEPAEQLDLRACKACGAVGYIRKDGCVNKLCALAALSVCACLSLVAELRLLLHFFFSLRSVAVLCFVNLRPPLHLQSPACRAVGSVCGQSRQAPLHAREVRGSPWRKGGREHPEAEEEEPWTEEKVVAEDGQGVARDLDDCEGRASYQGGSPGHFAFFLRAVACMSLKNSFRKGLLCRRFSLRAKAAGCPKGNWWDDNKRPLQTTAPWLFLDWRIFSYLQQTQAADPDKSAKHAAAAESRSPPPPAPLSPAPSFSSWVHVQAV